MALPGRCARTSTPPTVPVSYTHLDVYKRQEWTSLFSENGMRMFAFTTKHHEGFSMFDTRTRVRQRIRWDAAGGPTLENSDLAYSIMETPFRRDIVKELCAAGRKRDLRIALYFSHPDWYDADFRPYADHPAQVPSSANLDTEWMESRKRLGRLIWMAPDPTPEAVSYTHLDVYKRQATTLSISC